MRTPYLVLGALALSCVSAEEADSIEGQTPVAPEVQRPIFEPYPTSGSRAFIEQFTPDWTSRWSASEATKDESFSYVGKWAVKEPTVFPAIVGDEALVATSKAAHHAISATLDNPVDPSKEDVVVQYEVKLQNGLECGGAYIKLLSDSDEGVHAQEFSDKTPYSIMFGPDKCGATNKVHVILRHKNPVNGEIEEKHLKAPPQPRISKTTNLYTLHLSHNDQSYEVFINGVSAKKGLLEEDFNPSFTPESEIDDPNDTKPESWVDQAKITDADATKPSDWDEDAPLEIVDEDAEMPDGWLENEPATIPDPDAEKPEEWDDEEDGDWVAPSVPNPKCEDAPGCGPWTRPMKSNPSYKGKWYAPLIDNPLYKGIWKAARIANPAYFEDKSPLSNIGKIAAVGFEIWSMQSDITFDNIYIGSSLSEAQDFAKSTFDIKKPVEDSADAAEKPKDAHFHKDPTDAFDFEQLKADPVRYLRLKAANFVDDLRADPVGTLKGQPQTGAVLGGLIAMTVGLLGLVLSLLSPKPKVIKKKVSEGVQSTKEKTKALSNEAKAATTSAIDSNPSAPTIKKRTTVTTVVKPAPAI